MTHHRNMWWIPVSVLWFLRLRLCSFSPIIYPPFSNTPQQLWLAENLKTGYGERITPFCDFLKKKRIQVDIVCKFLHIFVTRWYHSCLSSMRWYYQLVLLLFLQIIVFLQSVFYGCRTDGRLLRLKSAENTTEINLSVVNRWKRCFWLFSWDLSLCWLPVTASVIVRWSNVMDISMKLTWNMHARTMMSSPL